LLSYQSPGININLTVRSGRTGHLFHVNTNGSNFRVGSQLKVAAPVGLEVRMDGGTKPYHYSLVRHPPSIPASPVNAVVETIVGPSQSAIVVAEGNGLPEGGNPFDVENFKLEWTGSDEPPGTTLVFQVVDAKGVTISQKIEVLPNGEILFNPLTN
jgi:hypothetical protein